MGNFYSVLTYLALASAPTVPGELWPSPLPHPQ